MHGEVGWLAVEVRESASEPGMKRDGCGAKEGSLGAASGAGLGGAMSWARGPLRVGEGREGTRGS